MQSFGWLSIVPPVVAIALAIKTKQVFFSLALFVWLGWTIMSGCNPVAGLIESIDTFIASVTTPVNARILLFSALIGAMITYTQFSGGMQGFVNWIERTLEDGRSVRYEITPVRGPGRLPISLLRDHDPMAMRTAAASGSGHSKYQG